MFEPVRGGTRGGQAEFKWSDVSADKDRENYLGHSINAPTGRWQKNKDVHWYSRDVATADAERAEEIRKIKEAEADALAVALGFAPAAKPGTTPSAKPNPNLIPIQGKSADVDDEKLKEKEKKKRKEERRARKEEKRARRERERRGSPGTRRERSRSDRSRSRSPVRRPAVSRSPPPPRGREPATRVRDYPPRRPRSGSPVDEYDEVERERERERDRRRWERERRDRDGGGVGWGRK